MATPVMARAFHIGSQPELAVRETNMMLGALGRTTSADGGCWTAGAVIMNMPWIERGGTKFVRPGLDGRVHHVPGAGQCAFARGEFGSLPAEGSSALSAR